MHKYAGKSDKGLIRDRNEDAFCLNGGADGAPLLLSVADGMGGHRAGVVASQTAIRVINDSLASKPITDSGDDAVSARLFELVRAANEVIFKKSVMNPEYVGMGTTLIIAAVAGKRAFIAHVGDSCAYSVRDNKLEKITTDHTYVEELCRIGQITREEAAVHPKRNVITRAVGCMPRVACDIYTHEFAPGDRLLLCTDGLSKMLTETEIAETATNTGDASAICDALIEKANHRGGLDNITVIVYMFGD